MSHFIPRGNRYYAFLASLSRPLRYTISVTILCSCVGSWYLLIYNPAKKQLQRYAAEKDTYLEQLQASKNIHASIAAEAINKTQMQEEYALLQIPDIQDTLLTLAHDTQKSGLVLDSCAQAHNQNNFIFKAHGIKSALEKFLALLKSRPALRCTRLSIHANENMRYQLECHIEHIANQKK
ncbi:MAG: hypothetical protein M1114_00170 [Candidatus Dependentiae bacterium]|nr:hypothetical protein [Candidatus Dependentiae bacterium]